MQSPLYAFESKFKYCKYLFQKISFFENLPLQLSFGDDALGGIYALRFFCTALAGW